MVKETSNERWERLKREGRWEEFSHRRKFRIEILGMRPKLADSITVSEFQPLEPGEEWTALPDLTVDESQVATQQLVTKTTTVPNPPPTTPVPSPDSKPTVIKPAGRQMLTQDMFAGKRKSNPLKDITWVAENLAFSEVDLSSAPSAAAAYIWQQCKYKGFEPTFWGELYPKIVPSKSAVEDAFRKLVDDGVAEEDLVEFVRGISKRIKAEGSEAEKAAFSDLAGSLGVTSAGV